MLNITHATKKYSRGNLVRGITDVSLKVETGEIVCILGSSGSGKSTLLRVAAGLEPLDSGSLTQDPNIFSSYVSQEYTLWPHLTIIENMTLAPKLNTATSIENLRTEALTLLKRFELEDYADTYPTQLSGGQRQRVALLRAVIMKPRILLLDEITSALDPELTKSVLDLIRALAKDGYTMIIVTHHMSFALSVADRIIFLKNGSVAADQTTHEFFFNQSNPEIKSFIIDIAKKDDMVEIFKGVEQFQAYHIGLIRKLPECSIIHVAGAVGNSWYIPMGDFYEKYEHLRHQKKIIWKMVTYEQGVIDKRLLKEFPEYNQYRQMPRALQNPANYNVFGDTVITQIFENEPTIIQIRSQHVANAYLRFFEELWELSK
ncbi:MAG: ATP-binding cassette domain-containing protein [bacterium]